MRLVQHARVEARGRKPSVLVALAGRGADAQGGAAHAAALRTGVAVLGVIPGIGLADHIRSLAEASSGVLSTQVMQEFYVAATRKLGVDPIEAKGILSSFGNFEVVEIAPRLIYDAIDCSVIEQLSFWDALIVVCAEAAACEVLASESFTTSFVNSLIVGAGTIDIRRDIAQPLGGEFAIALDGPILPNPSWKLILEVYDPEQLQTTLEWAVRKLTEAAATIGSRGVSIESEESGGRVYYRVVSLDTGLAAHYTFVDGYMLAGASKALLDRAMQYRDSGLTLANSRRFLDLTKVESHIMSEYVLRD